MIKFKFKNMNSKDDMVIISLLVRSENRIKVLKSLKSGDKIPSIISKEIWDNSNHISKYLKTLKEVELVECLNEEDKRYRFYHLTDKGRYYLDKVEKEYNDYF